MAKLDLNSKDVLMLILHTPTNNHAGSSIVGRTRVTKLMFIFQKEIYPKFKNDDITLEAIKFEAWDFGPWSKDIYDDIEFLSNVGFVDVTKSDAEAEYSEAAEFDRWGNGLGDSDSEVEEFEQEEFTLTGLGTSYVEEKLWGNLSVNQIAVLRSFKEKLNTVPLRVLLRYVYTNYPETTTNSKIRDKVLG